MITKAELTNFIRNVAKGDYSRSEWETYAVNHYSDIHMESARSEMVRQKIGYKTEKEKERPLKERLNAIANTLDSK